MKEKAHAHESLNFGYPKFSAEPDGMYIGYVPSFNKQVRENGIKIVFFSCLMAPNDTKIVGLYLFPEIVKGNGFERSQSLNPLYRKYPNGNIRAKAKNIIYLKNPVPINDDVTRKLNLFCGKNLSKQGFNYLEENGVKKLTDYKCLICEKLGMNPRSFVKRNGTYYVETHHVCPEPKQQVGSLSLPNLMTVCANHHRLLHYVQIRNDKFIVKIDNRKIEIKKIKVPD